jgi:hypothetical protein
MFFSFPHSPETLRILTGQPPNASQENAETKSPLETVPETTRQKMMMPGMPE